MLVVSRRPGDQIVIEPSGIRIVCLGPQRDKDGNITQSVRIGIDAPKSEKILRGEIAGYPRNYQPQPEEEMQNRGN